MLQPLPYTETFLGPCTDALFMRLVERACGWKPNDRDKCNEHTPLVWNSNVYAIVITSAAPKTRKHEDF